MARHLPALVVASLALLTSSCAVYNARNPSSALQVDPFESLPGIWASDLGGVIEFEGNRTGVTNTGPILEALHQRSGCERAASWGFAWSVEERDGLESLVLLNSTSELARLSVLGCDASGFEQVFPIDSFTSNQFVLEAAGGAEVFDRVFEDTHPPYFPEQTDLILINLGQSQGGAPLHVLTSSQTELPAPCQIAPYQPDDILQRWRMVSLFDAPRFRFLQNQSPTIGQPNSIEGGNGDAVASIVRVEQTVFSGTLWRLVLEDRCDRIDAAQCPDALGGPTALVFRLKTDFTEDSASLGYSPQFGDVRTVVDNRRDTDQLWIVGSSGAGL